MALTAAQALPIISKYESGDANVLTKIQPSLGPPNTASGYYQITNPTWQQYAPLAGVSLLEYPTAMGTTANPTPQDVQAKVATALYNDRGLQPWSSNAPLIAALTDADTGGVPVSTSTTTGTPTGSAPATTASGGGWYSSIWNYVSRGVLLLSGFILVFIALAAMLWAAKSTAIRSALATGGGGTNGGGSAGNPSRVSGALSGGIESGL